VNAERLRREFGDISFKPGESVEDFSLRLNSDQTAATRRP
jgi:hypothetical protein